MARKYNNRVTRNRIWLRVSPLRAMSNVEPRSCEDARYPSKGAAFGLNRPSRRCTSAGRMAESMTRVRARKHPSRRLANARASGRRYLRSFGSLAFIFTPVIGTNCPIFTASSTSYIVSYRRIPKTSARRFSAATLSCVAGKSLEVRAKHDVAHIKTKISKLIFEVLNSLLQYLDVQIRLFELKS